MGSADAQLVQHIQRATLGAARILCTLARHGKRVEHDQPDRAESMLSAVRYHPLYKGGRLAFDMLEIEDLMLEEASVPSIDGLDLFRLSSAGLTGLFDMLGRLGAEASDDSVVSSTKNTPESAARPNGGVPELPRVTFGAGLGGENGSVTRPKPSAHEPDLKSSDYLYDYVVLGILEVWSGRIP